MSMELCSRNASARGLANAVRWAEGNPLKIRSGFREGIDRVYAFRLISEAERAINGGQTGPSPKGTATAPAAAPGRGDE